MSPREPAVVVEAAGVGALRDGAAILADIDLRVREGEHWALLGPNGAGKSTLLSHLGGWRFPTRGAITVLGASLGSTDLRSLRQGIGWVDPRQAFRGSLRVREVVLTGATATTELLPRRRIPEVEHVLAAEVMDLLGVGPLADRALTTLSTGERGRALVARALLAAPPLLLLDEPMTGVDLPGRELFVGALARLASARPRLASVTVTHHLEELPPSTTHAALLRAGGLVAAGPVTQVLTPAAMTDCFGLPLTVERRAGRWWALAAS